MKTLKFNAKLTSEEKEAHLLYDYEAKTWVMDTTVMKLYNKAKKQGWEQICEYICDDGSVCGGVFKAPHYAVTIRSTDKKQMSDKQMSNLDKSVNIL